MSKGYGQLIIGPPGSGKSTYCKEMSKLLSDLGRKVSIINLDPANEIKIYEAALNISDLITVQDVMSHKHLGPNGSLIFCIEYLEENVNWLLSHLSGSTNNYFIFDCPGQVELYTHHKSMTNILEKIQNLDIKMCVINVIDSHYCSDPGKFVSSVLMSLITMFQLHLPHINVLSKVDMLKKFGDKLAFTLNYYTEVLDLQYILEGLEDNPLTARYEKLNSAIISLIEDHGLVSFMPLNVKDNRLMINLKKAIDKANGYIYNSREEQTVQMMLAHAVDAQSDHERFGQDNDLYTPTTSDLHTPTTSDLHTPTAI